MATIAQYPDGIAVAGPTIGKIFHYPLDYQVDVYRNEDGGADVNVQPCGVLKIELYYSGLSLTDLETVRDHLNLAKGRVNDFSFYSRYDETTYTGVKYELIEVPRHQRHWSKDLKVTLIKYL